MGLQTEELSGSREQRHALIRRPIIPDGLRLEGVKSLSLWAGANALQEALKRRDVSLHPEGAEPSTE